MVCGYVVPVTATVLVTTHTVKRRGSSAARFVGISLVSFALGQAGVPVIVVDSEGTAPALHSRYARKVLMPELSGYSLVRNLLRLQAGLNCRPVLFLTSDEAALAVSEHRAELESGYRFSLPAHDRLAALMKKNDFERLAISGTTPP